MRAEGFPGYAVLGWKSFLYVDSCAFLGNLIALSIDSIPGGGRIDVSDSYFSGHTSSAILTTGELIVADSVFEENSGSYGGAIHLSGDLSLDRAIFIGNTAITGGAVYASTYNPAWMGQNRFCGNTAEKGGAIDLGSELEGVGNVFAGNTATIAGGDLYLDDANTWRDSPSSLINNTFVGGSAPTGGALWSSEGLDFRNNIVAYTSEYGLFGDGGTAIIAYNDFWEVAPDAIGGTWTAPDSTNLAVDPMFVSYVEGGCEELDLGLLPDSPLRNAGDPTTFDTDGTVADIGATGDGVARWYRDADGDGHGSAGDVAYAEQAPTGYVSNAGDCDDGAASVYPGAVEICDGADQDCDGVVDDSADDAVTWRQDADGDGFQGATKTQSCEAPEGWAAKSGATDCDDLDPAIFPDASEICGDDVDQDCDGDDAACDTDLMEGSAVGGGCGGCSAGPAPSWVLLAVGAAIVQSRRNRAGPP